MKLAIGIPARYGSTRFPGKPLALIAGLTMLQRVYKTALAVRDHHPSVDIFITTEDKRIADHAAEIGAPCILTPASSPTGSDRLISAIRQLETWPDFIVNLQGDAPFTPPSVISGILDAFIKNPRSEVITPVHALSWADLDRLRARKKTTPFSGTTVTVSTTGRALWFSKNILPALRDEEGLRRAAPLSPVYQHIGLYGFRSDILEKFCALPPGRYETLEGLEQLRLLENGIEITALPVTLAEGAIQSGIDSPEDISRAVAFIKTHGDPHQ